MMCKLVGATDRVGRRALAALGLLIVLDLILTAAPLASVARAEQPTPQATLQQAAQEPASGLSLKTQTIAVMPEYDEPRVLVTYEGEFANTATFPKIVKFRVPKGAEIAQVCARPPNRDHDCQLYETSTEGDYTVINFTLPIPTWSLEYYYNPLQGSPDKSLTYDFSSPYPIDRLTVHAQQPLKASNFDIKPAPASVFTDGEGFKVSQYNYDKVLQDQKISLDIKYTKSDPSPSVKKQTNQQGGTSSSGGANSSVYFMIMGLAGGVIVLFGGFWIYNNRQKQPMPRAAMAGAHGGGRSRTGERRAWNTMSVSMRTSPTRGRSEAGGGRSKAFFCSSCGNEVEPNDRFCGVCGAKVKGK